MNLRQPHAFFAVWRSRIARFWREYYHVILTVTTLLTLLLGYLGYEQFNRKQGTGQTPLDNLFLAFSLFTFGAGQEGNVGPLLQVARWLAPIVVLAAGIQAFSALFREQIEAVRLSRCYGHLIICGLGEKGWLLAKSLADANQRLVVIESQADNTSLGACRDLRIPVLIGDATQPEILKKAGVQRASHLIAVCDGNTTNPDIAAQTRELLTKDATRNTLAPRGGAPFTCWIHLESDDLRDKLERRLTEVGQDSAVRFNFFNVYDSGSRSLLSLHPIRQNTDDGLPHVLLVGLGLLGENVLERIVLGHAEESGCLRVTILDPHATSRLNTLAYRNRSFEKCCFTTHNFDVDDLAFERGDWIKKTDGKKKDFTIAYVCLQDDERSLAATLHLREWFTGSSTRLIVCLQRENGLALLLRDLFSDKTDQRSDTFQIFGLLEQTFDADFPHSGTNEALAQAIHEDYREHHGGESWSDLKEKVKESNRTAADHIGVKLKAIGCELRPLSVPQNEASFPFGEAEIETLAEMEHERWMDEKERSIPPPREKAEGFKTHPDMLPWNELPETSKDKNREQIVDLPRVLAGAGYEIVRRP